MMIMIIGGAYQGKLAFAKKIYPDVTSADGAVCTEEEPAVSRRDISFPSVYRKKDKGRRTDR